MLHAYETSPMLSNPICARGVDLEWMDWICAQTCARTSHTRSTLRTFSRERVTASEIGAHRRTQRSALSAAQCCDLHGCKPFAKKGTHKRRAQNVCAEASDAA